MKCHVGDTALSADKIALRHGTVLSLYQEQRTAEVSYLVWYCMVRRNTTTVNLL
jgi:hypothetical protein